MFFMEFVISLYNIVELMKDHKASIPENYKGIISKISRKAYKNRKNIPKN